MPRLTEEELAVFEASADGLWLTSDQRRVVRKLVKAYRKDQVSEWVEWDATATYAHVGPHVPKDAMVDILVRDGFTVVNADSSLFHWGECGDGTITHYRLR